MKKSIYKLAFILLLCLLFIIEAIYDNKRHQEVTAKFARLDSLIQQRNHLDTLYWIHLEQCAFELRKGAEPDIKN